MPSHNESLLRITGVEAKLNLDLFAEWYINFIFRGEEEEVDEEEREFKTPSGGLSNQLVPKEGEAWRCTGCRVVNIWIQRRCIACEELAPHAVNKINGFFFD